jgi:hypothetical protein
MLPFLPRSPNILQCIVAKKKCTARRSLRLRRRVKLSRLRVKTVRKSPTQTKVSSWISFFRRGKNINFTWPSGVCGPNLPMRPSLPAAVHSVWGAAGPRYARPSSGLLVASVAHQPQLPRVGRIHQERSASLLGAPPGSTQVAVDLLATTVQLVDMARTKDHIHQWWSVCLAAGSQPWGAVDHCAVACGHCRATINMVWPLRPW